MQFLLATHIFILAWGGRVSLFMTFLSRLWLHLPVENTAISSECKLWRDRAWACDWTEPYLPPLQIIQCDLYILEPVEAHPPSLPRLWTQRGTEMQWGRYTAARVQRQNQMWPLACRHRTCFHVLTHPPVRGKTYTNRACLSFNLCKSTPNLQHPFLLSVTTNRANPVDTHPSSWKQADLKTLFGLSCQTVSEWMI